MLSGCASKEEKVAKFFKKGQAAYEKGNLTEARLAFKNMLQLNPKSADAYYWLGKVELKDDSIRLAFGNFNKAIELDETLLDVHVELGKMYLLAGQADKARVETYYILKNMPNHQQGRLLEAGILLAEKKVQQAQASLEKLRLEGVTDPQFFLMQASIRLKNNDPEGGRRELRNGIKANPDHLRLRAALTSLLEKDRLYDEAICVVKDVINIEPDDIRHKFKLASLFWEADRRTDTQTLLNQMISESDKSVDVRILAADFYTRQNETEKAVDCINNGITDHPDNIKLHLALARLQISQRKYDTALETLSNTLALTKDEADPDLLKVKNQLARLYLNKGDIETAQRYTNEVLAVSSKNLEAQFTAGQVYLQQKDTPNAISAFRNVVSDKPDFVGGYLHLAQAHWLNKEKNMAIDALTNGLSASPDDSRLRKALARVYVAEKDYHSAEKELRRMVEKDPADIRTAGDLADFLFNINKKNEATAIYEKIVADHPRVPAGYLKLAAMYRAQDRYDAALDLVEKGYNIIPNSPPILTELIKSYLASGAEEKALELLKGRIAKSDQDIFAHNLTGEIYLKKRQYENARKAFEHAIAVKPEWQTPHNNLVKVYLSQGKTDEAIDNLNAGLQTDPNNAAAYITLGYLYQTNGQEEQVMETYEKALTNLPDLWPAANNLAYLLAKNGSGPSDLDRAKELALTAVRLKPERPDVIDTLGWVHYQRGEIDLAIAELERAMELAPDSAIINYHLGLALKKANRTQEALEKLQKALSSDAFSEREAAEKALAEIL